MMKNNAVVFRVWVMTLCVWTAYGTTQDSGDEGEIIARLQDIIDSIQLKLQYLESKVDAHDADLDAVSDQLMNATAETSSGGAVFTRWGRSTCGLSNDRVYSGLMSKAYSGQAGSGVDFQCLPHIPEYADYVDGLQYGSPGRGLIYSTEYHGSPDEIFDHYNHGGSTFNSQNVPCAVCHISNSTSVLMIPAQTECPSGWTEEYWGYLQSAVYDNAGASTYACVDHAPETVNAAEANTNSADIYHVEVICEGSLPCPDYVEGRELTCVVCSK